MADENAGADAAPEAPDDFNREMADSEMDQIAGGDPPDAPSYSESTSAGWVTVVNENTRRRIVSALARRWRANQ